MDVQPPFLCYDGRGCLFVYEFDLAIWWCEGADRRSPEREPAAAFASARRCRRA